LSTNQMFFFLPLVFDATSGCPASRTTSTSERIPFLPPPRSGPSLRPTRAARSAGRCQTPRERHRGSGDARPADMGALGTCSRATPCPPSARLFRFSSRLPRPRRTRRTPSDDD
jgi:hypothetical protein